MSRRTQVLSRSFALLRLRGSHPVSPDFPFRSPETLPSALRQSFHPGPSAGLGSSPFARRYSGNHSYFPFLRVLRCFSSPGFAALLCCPVSIPGGFPHSDIGGSLHAYCSPPHFAVCCVLLRLSVPRHPPYALFSFTLLLCLFTFCLFRCCFLVFSTFSERPQTLVFRSLLSFVFRIFCLSGFQ